MHTGLQTEAREEAGETVRSCPAYSKFVPAVLEDMEEREVTSRRRALRPAKYHDGGWKHAEWAGAMEDGIIVSAHGQTLQENQRIQETGSRLKSMAEVGNS